MSDSSPKSGPLLRRCSDPAELAELGADGSPTPDSTPLVSDDSLRTPAEIVLSFLSLEAWGRSVQGSGITPRLITDTLHRLMTDEDSPGMTRLKALEVFQEWNLKVAGANRLIKTVQNRTVMLKGSPDDPNRAITERVESTQEIAGAIEDTRSALDDILPRSLKAPTDGSADDAIDAQYEPRD